MKKLLSIAAVAALVLTGCNKDLKVTPADKLTIEYGDKTLTNNKLFDAKKSDKNIKVDKVQNFTSSERLANLFHDSRHHRNRVQPFLSAHVPGL